MLIQTPRDIGLVIRARRRELGLTQHALAEQLGVSRQWIIDVEKGKPRAEAGLLLRALRVLGVQLVAESEGRDEPGDGLPVPDIDIDAVITRARGGAHDQ